MSRLKAIFFTWTCFYACFSNLYLFLNTLPVIDIINVSLSFGYCWLDFASIYKFKVYTSPSKSLAWNSYACCGALNLACCNALDSLSFSALGTFVTNSFFDLACFNCCGALVAFILFSNLYCFLNHFTSNMILMFS